jgi:hypothetical protein
MAKKTLIDTDGVKSISVKATECGVPERWLRGRVAAGEVLHVRIGWNVFVPESETEKIKKLAAQREKP